MLDFDFINVEDFRLALQADYAELEVAMQNEAWKTVQILAGSIVEAILIDYLVFSDYQKKTSKDPLRMALSEAISACREESVISEETVHLSHLIRSYRNLIHPGRSVRLGEKATKKKAKAAQLLLEMIIDEVAQRRKQNYGYTANQILTKIEKDRSSIAILKHLLKETNLYEKEKLLLKIIPEKYFDIMISDPTSQMLKSLTACYRTTFSAAPKELKVKVTKDFVRVIKEESAENEWRYAFFRGSDLEHLSSQDASLLKDHFLSVLTMPIKGIMLVAMEGLGTFLEKDDASNFIIPFVNSIALYGSGLRQDSNENEEKFSNQEALEMLNTVRAYTTYDFDKAVRATLLETYQNSGAKEEAHIREAIKQIHPIFTYTTLQEDLKHYIDTGEVYLGKFDEDLGDLGDHPF